MNGTASIHEVLKFLYDQQDLDSKANITIYTFDSIEPSKEHKIEKFYRQPHGLCIDIEDLKKYYVDIIFDFDAELYLIDPLLDNFVFTGTHSMIGEPITIGKNEKNIISLDVETVKTVYSKDLTECSETTYNTCLLNFISTELLPACLPPWITLNQNDYKTCSDAELNDLTKEMDEKWFKLCVDLYDNHWPDVLKVCSRPCTKYLYTMKKTRAVSNLNNSECSLSIHFNDPIKVREQALEYGFFDMMVEIGSSLGLWLGLSALDLLAYNLQLNEKIISMWNTFMKLK